MENDVRLKRLLYQSWYRGCKETDQILGGFARKNLEHFNAHQLDEFEAIMGEDDQDIFDWVSLKKPCPERMQNNSVFQHLLRAYQLEQNK